MGYLLVGNTPEQFATFLREQTERWTQIVKDNNIRAE